MEGRDPQRRRLTWKDILRTDRQKKWSYKGPKRSEESPQTRPEQKEKKQKRKTWDGGWRGQGASKNKHNLFDFGQFDFGHLAEIEIGRSQNCRNQKKKKKALPFGRNKLAQTHITRRHFTGQKIPIGQNKKYCQTFHSPKMVRLFFFLLGVFLFFSSCSLFCFVFSCLLFLFPLFLALLSLVRNYISFSAILSFLHYSFLVLSLFSKFSMCCCFLFDVSVFY